MTERLMGVVDVQTVPTGHYPTAAAPMTAPSDTLVGLFCPVHRLPEHTHNPCSHPVDLDHSVLIKRNLASMFDLMEECI